MPGQHFDLAELGIDPDKSDEAARILNVEGRWAFIVDPDIVGPPQNLGSICIQLMQRGAKIYASQHGRSEAEVLMEILASLDHYLQQPPETSH